MHLFWFSTGPYSSSEEISCRFNADNRFGDRLLVLSNGVIFLERAAGYDWCHRHDFPGLGFRRRSHFAALGSSRISIVTMRCLVISEIDIFLTSISIPIMFCFWNCRRSRELALGKCLQLMTFHRIRVSDGQEVLLFGPLREILSHPNLRFVRRI
jgi:hypothetical protein